VIDIQNELGAIKIRPKMYNDPYNNKTLTLVRRVVALSLIVSRCIGDNIFLAFLIKLAKNSTIARKF
jgi:hypothetical protein